MYDINRLENIIEYFKYRRDWNIFNMASDLGLTWADDPDDIIPNNINTFKIQHYSTIIIFWQRSV